MTQTYSNFELRHGQQWPNLMPDGGGQFRQQQNQIAKGKKTIIYTPPAAPQVAPLISNWENYVHSDDGLDPLIRVAVCHYQFAAIHPFSDGNGRTGRILMVLQLVLSEMLEYPILCISVYLNQNRDEYYRLLNDVTHKESWIEYIRFMLTALYEQATTTQVIVEKLLDERARLKNRIRDDFPQIYSPDLLDHLFSYAVTCPTFMANKLNITYQTASKYLSMLEDGGILEKKKSGRNNFYTNPKIMGWLQDKGSCYNRTIDLIAAYSEIGKFGPNNKSCDLASGNKVVFSTSMDAMLKGATPVDWNFSMKSSAGQDLYSINKRNVSDNSFRLDGVDKSGHGLRASFNEIAGEDSQIIYTARCDNYDSRGETEYVITWDAYWAAQSLCPQQLGTNRRTHPVMSYSYSQIYSKIQLVPFFDNTVPFFTCRNF